MKTLYQNITLPVCNKDTVARADDVFSYIDSDFTNWNLDVKSPKTESTEMAVLEMDKDGTFKDIFTSINPNLDSMCLTQAQIIRFCEKNKDKLRTDGCGTFFLFKKDNEHFVAYVRVNSVGTLFVDVGRFSHDYVWRAGRRHRVVSPQVALKLEPETLGNLDSLTLRVGELERKLAEIGKIISNK